jgi:hypothetical protein
MKKKEEVVTIDPQVEQDGKEILRLRRITSPSGNDIEIIYRIYQKYINKSAMPPITSCSTCERSINNYYWQSVALPTDPIELEKLKK